MMKQKKILFYSSVRTIELFKTQKFYQIDIEILEKLGFKVIVTNKISESFKFWNYDILFSYFYRYSFFSSFIARCLGKKVYFTGGIDDLDKSYASGRRYFVQKLFFILCYWVSNSCIIVSSADYRNIVCFFNRKNKLSFSEHAIDTKMFFSEKFTKEPIFSTIVWMGNEENVKRKGVDRALYLFYRLKENSKFANYKFYIIGKKGEGENYVLKLVEKYELTDSVIITGEVSEQVKISLLKRSKYYFQLSLYEGFGIAALEALCSGCILIHSGKGGLSNTVYSDQILFNIDEDFDLAYDKLLIALQDFSHSASKDKMLFYDIERRKRDFEKILCG